MFLLSQGITMKKITLTLISSTILTCLAVTPQNALADAAPYNSVNMQDIIEKSHQQGLVHIQEISYHHNNYTVEGFMSNGLEGEIEFNSQTGQMLSEPLKTEKIISMKQAVINVEKKNYNHIYAIERKDDHYEIKAVDNKNRKVEIDVDYKTGEVGDGWF